MSEANVQLVMNAVMAWERDGVDGFLAFLDQDVEFWPADERGPLLGHHGVRRNLDPWFDAWEEFAVEIAEIVDGDPRVFVARRVSARGKGGGVQVAMGLYDVFELRNGLVVKWEEYADREHAVGAFRAGA